MIGPEMGGGSRTGRLPGLTIVGGGPAGLAILLAAQRTRSLDRLLDAGVVVVEASPTLGAGSIGSHIIRSDSGGATFLDCLRGSAVTPLAALMDHPLFQAIMAAGDGAVPLQDVGRFLAMVGEVVGAMVAAHPRCEVLTGHVAQSVQRVGSCWQVVMQAVTGETKTIMSRNVALATGAHQPSGRLDTESVAGIALQERCGDRLLQSGEVLSSAGFASVAARLADQRSPRVVVVGGSTSAVSVCQVLLNGAPTLSFGAGGVTLLHRRPLRIYYPDVASARTAGCRDFTDDDVCPLTGRVFRLAGLRLDSAELIMRAQGIGGRPPEPRLHLHQLTQPCDAAALRALDHADLVVAAFGYRPHALPVLNQRGVGIPLLAHTGPQQRLVDGTCHVLDAAERPMPGLFGIGLAAGFVPEGRLGGEVSFRGQANGLWTWQNDVGALIVDAVCAASESHDLSAMRPSKPVDPRRSILLAAE